MRRAPERIHPFPPIGDLGDREQMAPAVGDAFAGGVIAEMCRTPAYPSTVVRIFLADGSVIEYTEGGLGVYELSHAMFAPDAL